MLTLQKEKLDLMSEIVDLGDEAGFGAVRHLPAIMVLDFHVQFQCVAFQFTYHVSGSQMSIFKNELTQL